jgi:protein disulfide-isomerase
MKKLLLTVLLASAAWMVGAAELHWTTDLPKAQAKAKAEKKMVFLNFTGSDWCGWCIKLEKDVFSKPDFIKFAEKNLVMVTVDFPNKKKLAPDQKKANDALKAKYNVRGFPTLIVLNGAGDKVFEKVGYMDGVQKWIDELEAAKKK